MSSSYYKWKTAITCNPPITLCATFVPCLIFFAQDYRSSSLQDYRSSSLQDVQEHVFFNAIWIFVSLLVSESLILSYLRFEDVR